jgi:hypothetical protein
MVSGLTWSDARLMHITMAQEAAHATPDRQATLVIVNAKVWTGATHAVGADPAAPTALAAAGDRLIYVGDDPGARALVGPRTRVIDAEGRRVIPGITDSHVHLIGGGLQLGRLYLRAAGDRTSFVDAVAKDAASRKQGEWVLGGRWSTESWVDPTQPDKGWLDPVTGSVPVFLTRMDGHQALVNSAALRLAGITASGPPDPEGGQIDRDRRTGEPTGILRESAMDLVSRHIPPVSVTDRFEALQRAMRHANALGITSVHDMSELEDLEVYREAAAKGVLTLRVHSYLSVSDWPRHLETVLFYPRESGLFRVEGFKGYMDGSLGSRTAYMREPYLDLPPSSEHPRGQLTAMADPPSEFAAMIETMDEAGVQLAVHAIGDEGNHLLLNAYEQARAHGSRRNARPRVEHAQHLLPSDIPRFARLGVVASMQPFHKADDGRYAERCLGKERLVGSYAFRALVDRGALVCFGSDWPVVTMNPFVGMEAAVTARTLGDDPESLDGPIWLADHSLTAEEALRAYTVSPPAAVGRAHDLGRLEVGKQADIVVLSADPLSIRPEQLSDVKAVCAVSAGTVVYGPPHEPNR